MNTEEFKNEIFNNLTDETKINEIINILVSAIAPTSYEKTLCKIKNMTGTLKFDELKFKNEEIEIKKLYKQIEDEEICFGCYSYPNGNYYWYEEDYDIHYFSNKKMNLVLNRTYEYGKSLIYHKKYTKAIEMFELILFTEYSCDEFGNPEYDDSDEIYETFTVNIANLRDFLDFNLDYVCLYAIYAQILSNDKNKYSKIYKYLSLCNHHKIEDSFDLGIESVSDKKTFINEWNNYLKNKNSEQAQKFLVEVSN